MAVLGQTGRLLAVTSCLLTVLRLAGAAQMSPIEKTIELLTKLQASIVTDGEAQQESYAKYASWCSNSAQVKKQEIKTSSRDKVKLQADIQEAISDIDKADAKIGQLSKAQTTSSRKLKDATSIRESEAKNFLTAEKELTESIDMLDKAIRVMEKKGAKAFMQVKGGADSIEGVLLGLRSVVEAAGLEAGDQRRLAALLEQQQTADSDAEVGAPDAQTYRSSSQGLIEMMEDIRDQAEVQLKTCRESESNARHNYDLLKQSLENEIKNAETDLAEEKQNKAAGSEKKSSAEGDLAVTTKALKESTKALDNIQSSCMQTAADHETAVKGRKAELKALQEAKALIQSTMAGSLLQQPDSFLQMATKSRHTHTSSANAGARAELTKAILIVKHLATKHQSTELSQLASRLTAVARYSAKTGDSSPFVKVIGMVRDMIAKMEKELSQDEEQHVYCMSELKKTKEHHETLTDTNEGLQAKIDQLTASSVKLQGQVQELQAELAELEKLLQRLDNVRETAHKAYLKAKADLQQGLDSTRAAIRVLRDYYSQDEEEEGAAMLQTDESIASAMRQPAPPAGHKKAKGAGGGIISLLEVVESDIARNLAETETEEDGEVAEHESLVQENKVLKASKESDVRHKSKEHKGLQKAITDLTSDFDTSTLELEAVTEYYAKVKDQCIEKPSTYEERKKRRADQLKGLEEALKVLKSANAGGGSSFLQQRRD